MYSCRISKNTDKIVSYGWKFLKFTTDQGMGFFGGTSLLQQWALGMWFKACKFCYILIAIACKTLEDIDIFS